MMAAIATLAPTLGVVRACAVLGCNRASYYRWRQADPRPPSPVQRRTSTCRIADAQRAEILAVLVSDRFVDCAPKQVIAALLDDGIYLCSEATMYRILRANRACRERRAQRRHPKYVKPELLATAPNQVWTWDITRLAGPRPGTYFYLYLILDLYARYVVGWAIEASEDGDLAAALLRRTFTLRGIRATQLTCHSDRGSPMKAHVTSAAAAEFGVALSFSRPRVSDDNPFVEAVFKTLKYCARALGRSPSLEAARTGFAVLLDWYHHCHYHTGLALLTPASVYAGHPNAIIAQRQDVLDAAYAATPFRFRKPPVHPALPTVVAINPPEKTVGEPISE